MVLACADDAPPAARPAPATPPPEPAPGALWLGGDVHFGAASSGGLGDIAASLAGAAGIVNLEGPVVEGAGGASTAGGRVTLSNPADSGARLRAMGVVAVSVANNHAHDGDTDALHRTVGALAADGVAVAGPNPARFPVGEGTVTLLAYDVEDPATRDRLAGDLARPDATALMRVVSLHVTGPASYLPTPGLRTLVDLAVEAGADVVFAHGTHVVGPVERRGDTVIAWGLGNLLFDCPCTEDDEAIVLRVSLAAGHAATVIPVRAGLGGRPAGLAGDPAGVFTLLDALGGTRVARPTGDF
jgi:hypothetical protein